MFLSRWSAQLVRASLSSVGAIGRLARGDVASSAVAVLDRLMFRRPFRGASAHVYRTRARQAFGDFDERLLAQLEAQARGAHRLLEVGAGDATFARAAKMRFPHLQVLAVEPSAELAQAGAEAEAKADAEGQAARRGGAGVAVLRGRAEELPLADSSISLAVCVSSIRHVADRRRAFAELRRVLMPGGSLIIAELDPSSSAERIAYHAARLEVGWLRAAFGPLVVRTAPPWQVIAEGAGAAGFELVRYADDPVQPLYLLELRC